MIVENNEVCFNAFAAPVLISVQQLAHEADVFDLVDPD